MQERGPWVVGGQGSGAQRQASSERPGLLEAWAVLGKGACGLSLWAQCVRQER